jgi:hypothetical protein
MDKGPDNRSGLRLPAAGALSRSLCRSEDAAPFPD